MLERAEKDIAELKEKLADRQFVKFQNVIIDEDEYEKEIYKEHENFDDLSQDEKLIVMEKLDAKHRRVSINVDDI